MRRFFLTLTASLLATALLAESASAIGEKPGFLRKNALSPDGKTLAFCYKGDIFTVPVEGGKALQITSNAAYDSDPVWTADGEKIIFSSFREGSKDIFITSREGGVPKRVTAHPGNEVPKAVLPDGRILFTANIQDAPEYGGIPGDPQVYSVSPEGGRPELFTSITFSEISVNADGTILYEDYKGYEDPFRKHHTSSVTRDIWKYDGGSFTKLTNFNGEDRQPSFSPDGDTFYYISEQGGSNLNIFRSSLSNPSAREQLTFYTKNPVRYISAAKDGLTYSYNGDLYYLPYGGEARKIEISVVRDEQNKNKHKLSLSAGASAVSVSKDGKEVALVLRGDVFVTSVEYKTTKRITNTPEQERNVCFSPDGKALYYSSERDGHWGIYRCTTADKADKYFTYATSFKEELFSDKDETCFQPLVSPDGKWVAYLRDRTELVVKPTKGGKTKSLLKGVNYSYSDGDQEFAWSPDSRFLLSGYIADGGWHNSDIALIEVESGEITNLTRSGYSDGNFKWALGGKAMTWESDKQGYRSHGSWGAETDIYIMFFDGKTKAGFIQDKEDEDLAKMLKGEDKKKEKKDSTDKAEKKVEKLVFDLEGRDNRIMRLTKSSNRFGDHYLTKDGSKLYYTTPLESGFGLCVLDIRKGDIKVLERGVHGALIPSADEKFLYISSRGGLSKLPLGGGASKKISFSGEYEFKPGPEREYMFSHIWKQVKEKFYDPGLHGADWDYYKSNYASFLPYIDNYYDFQEMLSEMLGELNGSHTGARFYGRGGESMSYIGVILDPAYKGDGLKIAEILPDGVLNVADPEIKAGDIITAIGGEPIKAGDSWYRLLAGKAGAKTKVTIKKGGKEISLTVKPVSSESDLIYRRWVSQREKMVETLSGGKVGYVHVQGMNSASFREVYSKALGKYRNCQALIVDTRGNGGGWLHDDLVTFLGGKAYLEFKPRGQYIGTEPFNKWTKPSCVLVCEDNYSDACGFPYAYRALGLGKIIGAPVPGTMTAVWWERQINASIVFGIPQVGSWGLEEGRYIENFQIEPDILVYNTPESLLKGEDLQLEAAVAEMLKEIEK